MYQPTDSFDYTVYSNNDPTNCLSEPATVYFNIEPPELIPSFERTCAGLRCTFDASGSAGLGLSYSWDFGDGTSGAGEETVVHDYATVGDFNADLATLPTSLSKPASTGRMVRPVGRRR